MITTVAIILLGVLGLTLVLMDRIALACLCAVALLAVLLFGDLSGL